MSYVTVFEITHDSSLSWWPFLVLPLANGLIGTVILLLTRNLGSTTKLVRSFVFLYACLLVVLLAYNFRNRSRYVQAYRSGKYAVVEGPVERYSWNVSAFMTWSFAVAQVIPINSPGPAGLTQKGLPVRVAYSEMEKFPKILRLKIARNSR